MASSTMNENTQTKTCQCGDGDKSIWNPKTPESSDKQPQKCPNCLILKSGFLFISSKGIGWTSWKKRWFVLTLKSLVFYRSDPNALPQKGSEANPTLGGIDLNNSGSVVVKADKKLLTVFFPDGLDGRTLTLKGETLEELQEWKTALEGALAQAPSAALDMGQNGIFRIETANSVEASFEQWQDKKPINSMVVGRPVILALEDVDGSPSFLEKALRFIEEYGIKVEGILRQSADVEEVERRVQEFEQGKIEFSADEDAHVIGDCIKHVLREMPSSPVPARCCTALVDAYRTDRGNRINAIRAAISETFPEPNLRLLQRILKMMAVVASHRSVNRMSLSALAACMAPLLLRPLLAGDCEFEDNFNMGGDGSIQLLKAAAAANHAQAIVIIMLEEYDRIFDEELSQDGSYSSEIYTDSEEHYNEDDESADNDILEDDDYSDSHNGRDADFDDDLEHSSSGTVSGSGSYSGSDVSENEESDGSSYSSSPRDTESVGATKTASSASDATTLVQDISQKTSTDVSLPQETGAQKNSVMSNDDSDSAASPSNKTNDSIDNVRKSSSMQKSVSSTLSGSPAKFKIKSNRPTSSMRRPTKWGRTPARKDVPKESTDSSDDEIAIQRLKTTKSDLETRITKEVKGNEVLRESLERRKEALHERRLVLEKDVEILREQLEKERGLRLSLESGLMNMRPGHVSISYAVDSKTREDLEEIKRAEADIINLKQKANDLRGQLTNLQQPNNALLCISCKRQLDENEKNEEKIIDSDRLHQNENSATSDNVSALTDGEDVTAKSHTSPKGEHGKLKLTNKKKDEMIDALNNSTPRSENSIDTENEIPQNKDSLPLTVKNPSKGENTKSGGSPTLVSHKLPRQSTNQNKTKSNNTSSTEEPIALTRNYASKRSSFRAENEKSFKSEDGAPSSSSSALTRLTNRLNFLKERRLLLANELQNLDAKGTSGPDLPQRTNSR